MWFKDKIMGDDGIIEIGRNNNNGSWKSLDLMRNGYSARCGIGGHANNGYGPTLECWHPNGTAFQSRLDVAGDRLSFFQQGGDKTFVIFYYIF